MADPDPEAAQIKRANDNAMWRWERDNLTRAKTWDTEERRRYGVIVCVVAVLGLMLLGMCMTLYR
jgi:hypothetical protein